jgi:5-methylcytosine-specific restriction endonuclease McrA
MRRRLYAELGYSSINQYARQELGFSKSRTWDFVKLVRRLEELPAVRKAVVSGELGYTKAREVVAVATPATEERWLEAAKMPRRELVREVKRARRAAKVDPGQGELLPSDPVVAPRELPVRFQLDLTPEQEARRAALVERLHKLGGATADRAELLLEALAALVETRERSPRGDRPPVQVHVHKCPECEKTEVGGRELGRAHRERLECDAAVCEEGGRNTSVIPPRIRRQVLARDRHRCRAPGCDRTRFLEVHHITPRRHGGTNKPENLVTLCAACHRLWHERGRREVVAPAAVSR